MDAITVYLPRVRFVKHINIIAVLAFKVPFQTTDDLV